MGETVKRHLLALVLVLEEEQVELDELELKREGKVDEADIPISINLDLTTLRITFSTAKKP